MARGWHLFAYGARLLAAALIGGTGGTTFAVATDSAVDDYDSDLAAYDEEDEFAVDPAISAAAAAVGVDE